MKLSRLRTGFFPLEITEFRWVEFPITRTHFDSFFELEATNFSWKIQHITSFEQAISINQNIQRTTLAMAFLYRSFKRWHRTRRNSYIYLFTKYVVPKVKSFTCIGKYLIFNETYCSTYPTRKCRNLYLKMSFVGITSNKEETRLVIHACLYLWCSCAKKNVFTFS